MGSAVAVVGASVAATSVTFSPASLSQPKFEGLLSQAAYIADLGQGKAIEYSSYRDTLAEFVGQVSALYIAADSLPVGLNQDNVVAALHVSDIHDNPQAYDVIEQLHTQFAIDVVIDTGDIVSWGTPLENELLHRIGTLEVPYVYISGNHDGAAAAATVEAQPNTTVLDNEVVEVAGLRIAGIGDPRFAADDDSDAGGWREGDEAVDASVFQLGDTIEAYDAAHPEEPVDISLVHDPTQPEGLLGRAPLVLSGHMHTSKVELDRDGSGTDWMIVGSTGGALASGGISPMLSGEDPLDLTARMLYFDEDTRRLVAYDDIVMGGLGLVSVSIERTQMPEEVPELEVPEDAETPEKTGPPEQEVEPGEGLPDEDRVTPTDPVSPLPETRVRRPRAATAARAEPSDLSAPCSTSAGSMSPSSPFGGPARGAGSTMAVHIHDQRVERCLNPPRTPMRPCRPPPPSSRAPAHPHSPNRSRPSLISMSARTSSTLWPPRASPPPSRSSR